LHHERGAVHHEREAAPHEREAVLRVLSAASFLIFFQSYLFAPLIPALSRQFAARPFFVGLLAPAYLIPYAISTLVYGPLSDRMGRRKILLWLLSLSVLTTAATAAARSMEELLLWRALVGIANGGIIPLGLALLGDLYPFKERGRPVGWMFGAIAGGMAFGSTIGALLNQSVGWRAMFIGLAFASAVVALIAFRHRNALDAHTGSNTAANLRDVIDGYLSLIRNPRGRRTYSFIVLNGIFHSGVFTWLGLYFSVRYHLSDRGIGLALLGYGVPGLFLGPIFGRIADRFGRGRIIPAGILLAATSAALLILHLPIVAAGILVTILSLGFDMSHPLLAGLITSIDPKRRGQAMGLNACILFLGFGLGSLLFGAAINAGFGVALGIFCAVEAALGFAAIPAFVMETPHFQEHGGQHA
jgi:predicted MFS family arabinose efflux permease